MCKPPKVNWSRYHDTAALLELGVIAPGKAALPQLEEKGIRPSILIRTAKGWRVFVSKLETTRHLRPRLLPNMGPDDSGEAEATPAKETAPQGQPEAPEPVAALTGQVEHLAKVVAAVIAELPAIKAGNTEGQP